MVNASELGHFDMLSTLLNTYFKPKQRSYRPKMRPDEDREGVVVGGPLELGDLPIFTTFPGLLTKRIGNVVVFPALCKPRYAGMSQNSSKTPLLSVWISRVASLPQTLYMTFTFTFPSQV